MSVKRNKDGSVTIRTENGAISIGKIISVSVDNRKEKYHQWVEDCARKVTACGHTIEETEQYFLQQCEALPLEKDSMKMKSFKVNVIMNYYKDKLEHRAIEFSFDMSDEEMEKWHKEERAIREEASNSPPERFGLNMRGYYLPRSERNRDIYEEAYLEAKEMMKGDKHQTPKTEMPDIYFFFEETTDHCQSSGGGRRLMQKLIAFRGVSKEDIEKRTPRFLGYISALRELGELPDFMERE